MTTRVRRRTAATVGVGAAALALAVAGAALEHRADSQVDLWFVLVSLLTGATFAAIGALLIGLRPGNGLGPLLYASGTSLVLMFALREYAFRGLHMTPGSLPVPNVAGWAGLAMNACFFPVPVALVLLLFPDGRPPLGWGRTVVGAGLALVGVSTALLALRPGPLSDESYGYEIPWRGVLPAVAGRPVITALDVINNIGLLLLGGAIVSLLVRYGRADATARQQLKPLALVGLAVTASLLIQQAPGLYGFGVFCLVISVAVGLPLALGIGALRYRVWDLDPILVTTIVYGVLAVLVTATYIGVVVGAAALVGSQAREPGLLASIAATTLIAVLFAPVKERVTRITRRVVYGVRASPYEALVALPHQLSEAPEVDEVLPRTADVLTRGLGVPRARVRAFLDGAPRVVWAPRPPDTEPEPELVTVAVRHLGETVGDVAVQPWPDRPLTSSDRRLLADLATQVGPALRAVALSAELRARLEQITEQSRQLQASRQRIAAAQVAERRRLERDIHDGAQQRLVGLAVGIQAAEALLATDEDACRIALQRCRIDLDHCIDDLRELARGVYPPVLAARGLAAALRARARVAGGNVRVVPPMIDSTRFGADIELAVYFTCLEAMQNAFKHAPDAPLLIELSISENSLGFSVTDEGLGFDPLAAASLGTGLLGMADRIGSVGGALTIESAPGHGATVRGSVPINPPQE